MQDKRWLGLLSLLLVVFWLVSPVAHLITREPWGRRVHVPAQSTPLRHQPPRWNSGLIGVREQLVYRRVGQRVMTLFLFHPSRPAMSPRPVVVYVHGGALRFGTAVITDTNTPHNRFLTAVERRVIRQGMDFVSVNYRLAPRHPWPEPLHDVKQAVRYLEEQGHHLGVNPGRIDMMGDSAGGELAMFVGLTLTDQDGKPAVRGVVDLFGPADRQRLAREWRSRPSLRPHPVFGLDTARPVRRESALAHVHPGAPPFLIIQGNRDRVVPPDQSRLLFQRLQENGVPATEILVRHAGHEFVARGAAIDPPIPVLADRVLQFLVRTTRTPADGGDTGVDGRYGSHGSR